MKKKSLFIISFLFLARACLATPSATISIPNSFSPNTTISSSEMNANFSAVSTGYNTHSHTDITQLGTITVGLWHGTLIATEYGGTGADLSSSAQGAIPYFSSGTAISSLAAGTSGYPLLTQGAGANPVFDQLDLTASVTGALPIANGGTGATTLGGANIALYTDTRIYVGTFQVDSSTTGDQSVTGVGFTPIGLFVMGTDDTTNETFFGASDGSTDETLYLYGANTWDTDTKLYANSDGSNAATATLKSFDADGFTITKAKSSSPSGTLDINYIAWR